MKYYGQISKMESQLNNPILYKMNIGENQIELNKLINTKIKIRFDNKIKCIECNKIIKKTFMQGYCYPCFISSPKTSDCIFKPHLCRAHIGDSKDMSWSQKNCLVEQYVYLSITSNLKVGVTRYSQIPTRWVDQGAHFAIKFAKTPNRYLAGLIELEISKYISDRTKWRQMLKGDFEKIDLIKMKYQLVKNLSLELASYIDNDDSITELKYPQINQLEKIISLNLEKKPDIEGLLTGIKGQYIILDNLYVLNIRKYTGYFLNFNFC